MKGQCHGCGAEVENVVQNRICVLDRVISSEPIEVLSCGCHEEKRKRALVMRAPMEMRESPGDRSAREKGL